VVKLASYKFHSVQIWFYIRCKHGNVAVLLTCQHVVQVEGYILSVWHCLWCLSCALSTWPKQHLISLWLSTCTSPWVYSFTSRAQLITGNAQVTSLWHFIKWEWPHGSMFSVPLEGTVPFQTQRSLMYAGQSKGWLQLQAKCIHPSQFKNWASLKFH